MRLLAGKAIEDGIFTLEGLARRCPSGAQEGDVHKAASTIATAFGARSPYIPTVRDLVSALTNLKMAESGIVARSLLTWLPWKEGKVVSNRLNSADECLAIQRISFFLFPALPDVEQATLVHQVYDALLHMDTHKRRLLFSRFLLVFFAPILEKGHPFDVLRECFHNFASLDLRAICREKEKIVRSAEDLKRYKYVAYLLLRDAFDLTVEESVLLRESLRESMHGYDLWDVREMNYSSMTEQNLPMEKAFAINEESMCVNHLKEAVVSDYWKRLGEYIEREEEEKKNRIIRRTLSCFYYPPRLEILQRIYDTRDRKRKEKREECGCSVMWGEPCYPCDHWS